MINEQDDFKDPQGYKELDAVHHDSWPGYGKACIVVTAVLLVYLVVIFVAGHGLGTH